MPDAVVHISFGDRWKRDVAWLTGPDAPRLADGPNLDVLHAAIDIVVGRRNVTRHIPDEPLLPFLDRWTTALAELAAGASKVVVHWDASPWHLALQRVSADDVALTLFRLSHDVHVELDDAHVRLDAVVDASRDAIGVALGGAGGALPAALAARLRNALERLVAPPDETWVPAAPSLLEPLSVETRASSHGALETEVDVGYPGIAEYRAQPRLDRHGCIAPGRVLLTAPGDGNVRLEMRVRPLVAFEGLVDALHAISAERRSSSAEPIAFGSWSVELRHDANRAVIRHHDQYVVFDADAWVRLVADHTDALCASLWRAVPAMASNDYLRELRRSARALRSTVLDVAARRGRVARRAARASAVGAGEDPTTLGFPVSALRRLRFARDWSRRVQQEQAGSWRLAGRTSALGFGNGVLECIDRLDGSSRWSAAAPDGAEWFEAELDTIVLVARDRVVALESDSGECRWSVACEPDTRVRPGRIDTLVAAGPRDVRLLDGRTGATRWRWSVGGHATPRRVVTLEDTVCVALSSGRVVGLRHGDGRVAWSWQASSGSLRVAACGGRLGVWTQGRADAPQQFVWLSPSDGASDAVLEAPGTPRSWHVSDGGFATIVDGASEDGVVLGDAARGQLRWFALERRARGCHRVANGAVLLGERTLWCVSDTGRVTWQEPLPDNWRDPRLADRNAADGVIVLRHDDAVVFYEAHTGVVLGDAPAFWEEASRLHVGSDGGWLLVEDGPGTGAWLHGVPAVGMLAALDGGRR